MGFKDFSNKATRNITPKWFDKNEQTLRFDLAIQRHNVWDEDRNSKYIHSLIDGYPYWPFIAQDNNDNDIWLMDGVQRISAIKRYRAGEYALTEQMPVGNDEVGYFDISGLKYDELPQIVRNELDRAPLTIYCYKDLDTLMRDEIFLRINNGMSFTRFELTRVFATTVVMDFIKEISTHEFWKNNISISDNMRNRYVDEELILMVLSVLVNGYNQGISGKELLQFAIQLKENGIPDYVKQQIRDVSDYMLAAVLTQEKFMKKVHIPGIFYQAAIAKNDEVVPENFGGWLQMWFKDPSTAYKDASRSKSASKESLKIRIDELNKAYNANISSATSYQLPQPKPEGKRKAGRPKKNGEVVIIQAASMPGSKLEPGPITDDSTKVESSEPTFISGMDDSTVI